MTLVVTKLGLERLDSIHFKVTNHGSKKSWLIPILYEVLSTLSVDLAWRQVLVVFFQLELNLTMSTLFV